MYRLTRLIAATIGFIPAWTLYAISFIVGLLFDAIKEGWRDGTSNKDT